MLPGTAKMCAGECMPLNAFRPKTIWQNITTATVCNLKAFFSKLLYLWRSQLDTIGAQRGTMQEKRYDCMLSSNS